MKGSVVSAMFVWLSMFGCGGGGAATGTSSGLPRTTPVKSLDAAQAATLCDWQSSRQGGYGRSASCADGSTQMTDPDKEMCVAAVSIVGTFCPTLAVGDLEDCANATQTDLCSFATQAACATLRACIGP